MLQRLLHIIQKPYIAIAWSVLVLILCSIPAQPNNAPDHFDKIVHWGAFGIGAALWYWAKPQPILIALVGIGYGLFIEIWQHFLPTGRTFDLWDAAADAVGVLMAIPIAKWFKEKIFTSLPQRQAQTGQNRT